MLVSFLLYEFCHFMINLENLTPAKLQQILNFCNSSLKLL